MEWNKKLQTDLVGDESTVNKLIEYIELHEDLTKELDNNKYKKYTLLTKKKITIIILIVRKLLLVLYYLKYILNILKKCRNI